MKVAFAGPFAARFVEPVRVRLTIPCEMVADTETGIVARLGDADVLVSLAFSPQMGLAANRLKLVQVPGAGLDRIDRTALPEGARLANAYGHEAGIAEYIFGAMLALSRSFAALDNQLRKGIWTSQWAVGQPAPPLWPELSGKTLVILGYGHIGQALASRARAFDMTVHAVRQRPDASPSNGVSVSGPDSIDDILPSADYLAITLPLTPHTRTLLDGRRLRLMKPSAMLVNVARAEIVDEHALYSALSDRRLAGAALDVWYNYPSAPGPVAPATAPFHTLDNVIMTPHVSGWTEGMLEARTAIISGNIVRTARGEQPVNMIEITV